MAARHTPGPWGFYGKIQSVGEEGDKADLYWGNVTPVPWRGYVCSILSADRIDGISREEAEANARLIAAAPELLEVVQGILAEDMLQYLPAEYIAKVRAVISKATGAHND